MRAYAALWVVGLHISVIGFAGRLGRVINSGVLAVDVFFVLSGLVLSLVYATVLPSAFSWSWYKRFVARRFAKVYPLHLVTFALAAALFLAARHLGLHFLDAQENMLRSAVCNLLLVHAFGGKMALSWNGPSWSLSAEWFAYTVLFAPMVFLLAGVRLRWIALANFLLFATLLVVFVLMPGSNPTGPAGVRILRIAPEFLAGYCLFRMLRMQPAQHAYRHGDRYTFAGLLLLLVILYGPLYLMLFFLPAILLVLGGAYAGGKVTDRFFGNRAAVLMGEASYSIYMTHMFVVVAGVFLFRRHPLGRAQLALACLVELAFAIALGYASFRYLEEPVRQWLVRLFAVGPSSPEALPGPVSTGLAAYTEVSATVG